MLQRIFDESIENLLIGAACDQVALAISGGSDSIALLYLMSDWSKRRGVKLTIFTVNHNLRSEAISEIEFVKKITTKLGHDFFAMSWHYQKKQFDKSFKPGLQEKARKGRYDLMSDKCHELGIYTLLTAHHYDDVLENYLMRKSKKSGIFGLSHGHIFFYNNIQILRPLISFSKHELIYYLQQNNIQWMEDISNYSDAYQRNRVRKQLALMSLEEKQVLISEIEQINIQAQELNSQLISFIGEFVRITNYGFACVDLKMLQVQSYDIRVQVLNYLMTIVSGQSELPRFRSVVKILELIDLNQNINCTLHGCVLKNYNDELLIFREYNAISNIVIKIDGEYLWDNRFMFEEEIKQPYIVDILTPMEYCEIKKHINLDNLAKIVGNNYKLILFTLPIIKNLEKIVAIPHISYYDVTEFKNNLNVIFRPNFVSRFTHFL